MQRLLVLLGAVLLSSTAVTHQEIHLPDVEQSGNLIYLTYFTAGLRVFDIKDPISPREAGRFIPRHRKRYGPMPPNDRPAPAAK